MGANTLQEGRGCRGNATTVANAVLHDPTLERREQQRELARSIYISSRVYENLRLATENLITTQRHYENHNAKQTTPMVCIHTTQTLTSRGQGYSFLARIPIFPTWAVTLMRVVAYLGKRGDQKPTTQSRSSSCPHPCQCMYVPTQHLAIHCAGNCNHDRPLADSSIAFWGFWSCPV